MGKKETWISSEGFGATYIHAKNKPGVYVLKELVRDENYNLLIKIVYVGSSSKLRQRLRGHRVYNWCFENNRNVCFYFRYDTDYIEVEKRLIKRLQPELNIIGKQKSITKNG